MSEMGKVIDFYQAKDLVNERKQKGNGKEVDMSMSMYMRPFNFFFVPNKEAIMIFAGILAAMLILPLFL